MSALLLGSISTICDTSEIQRGAFNSAFEEHGLDWRWEREYYQELLRGNGGEKRVAEEADRVGAEVDAAAVHATKSRRFQELMRSTGQVARPGVADTIAAAKAAGWKVGLVTTTSAENIAALFDALDGQVSRDDFDVIVDSDSVDRPKPDPASYELALRTLDETADRCVAVEDNVGGTQAASGAGVRCVAFANENTSAHDFGDTPRVSHLDFAELANDVPADA